MISSNYEIFSEAARLESFKKAAAALHLTGSAVSHSISSLEEKWGFPLFVRDKNSIRLTEEGMQMLFPVRELLQQEELVQERAAALRGRVLGKIRLAAFSSVCIAWMPHLIKRIHELYPELEVCMMQGEYEDVCDWIRTGVSDIGFVSIPFAPDLTEIPLHRDEIVCVAPADFVPANGRTVDVCDIEGQHLILWKNGYNTDTMKYINRYNIHAESRFYLKDDRAILTMIAAGEGICMMPRLAIPSDMEGISVWELEHPGERMIGLLIRNGSTLTPSARKILELIREDFADQ